MKTVIFDVDGVLLSEKRYFDVSALTVWEWYYSPSFMNLGHETVRAELTDEEIDALRARFWLDDAILIWLKKHGVNSNWDMTHAHIVATLWMLLEQYKADGHSLDDIVIESMADVCALGRRLQGYAVPDAAAVMERLARAVPDDAGKDDVFAYLTKAIEASLGIAAPWSALDSPLWQRHFEAFQEWYFGDELYEQTYGKTPYAPGKEGFLRREVPLGTAEGIRRMFQELKRRGYALAIATGRSYMEMAVPFAAYHWDEEFDPRHVATYTDVEEASKMLGLSLDKPNPFAYYAGAFGTYPERYAEYVSRPDEFKDGEYYIVGDSMADIWCAKAMGAVMIGTLTGLDGPAARAMFEAEQADYIVDSVEDILDILK